MTIRIIVAVHDLTDWFNQYIVGDTIPEPRSAVKSMWEPSCDWIAERIKDFVRLGQYPPGSRLPAERQLAEILSVNRTSLREALRSLASVGILETRRSSGTWISPTANEILAGTLEMATLLDEAALRDFVEVYELISLYIVERAAQRRTEADLAVLREAVTAMSEHPHGTRPNTLAHVRFHCGIAAAAHSPTAESVWHTVHDKKRNVDRATSKDPRIDKKRWTMINEVHERLLEAIVHQDVTAARRAMSMDMAVTTEYWKFLREQLLSASSYSHHPHHAKESETFS